MSRHDRGPYQDKTPNACLHGAEGQFGVVAQEVRHVEELGDELLHQVESVDSAIEPQSEESNPGVKRRRGAGGMSALRELQYSMEKII